jgi:hypothetical protein
VASYLTGYRVHPKLAVRAWQREVTLYKRIWPSTILSTLLDPVMYLLALGFGLGAYVGSIQGRPYLEFIAPGLVASSVMYAAIFEAAWFLYAAEHSCRSITARGTPLLQGWKHCNFQKIRHVSWKTTSALFHGSGTSARTPFA